MFKTPRIKIFNEGLAVMPLEEDAESGLVHSHICGHFVEGYSAGEIGGDEDPHLHLPRLLDAHPPVDLRPGYAGSVTEQIQDIHKFRRLCGRSFRAHRSQRRGKARPCLSAVEQCRVTHFKQSVDDFPHLGEHPQDGVKHKVVEGQGDVDDVPIRVGSGRVEVPAVRNFRRNKHDFSFPEGLLPVSDGADSAPGLDVVQFPGLLRMQVDLPARLQTHIVIGE